ncbi:MarR family winged helix-turn-helix transcriptional regulator [Donghicola mangrovi]|nr:MarR family winged helix-turn-helix transcriptional regulator [Donghicola mangrovi]
MAQAKTLTEQEMREQFNARLSSPVFERDGRTLLCVENYAPFLLNAVSSSWQRISGAIYRDQFGLGITDWRVIAMLGIEPDITAQRITEVVKLDKSAVSRSLKSLSESGHVIGHESGPSTRNKTWRLTEFGAQTHADILNIALNNELALVKDIPLADLEICLRVLRKMLENTTALED